jgi:hypothetical protein
MNGFRVNSFEPKLLRWWCTNREKLDMDPSYQRKGRLWSMTDKAFLIDSILNEYDLPKFYVADFTYGGGNLKPAGKPYAIVDGKQRFEAIFDFFDGRLTLDSDFRLESEPELKLVDLDTPIWLSVIQESPNPSTTFILLLCASLHRTKAVSTSYLSD